MSVDGAKYTLYSHDPLDVARAISSAGAESVYFSTEFFLLKIQVPGGGLKLCSLSTTDPGPCLELV